ncbi:MAG: hypothetical protein CFE45_00660 [Burkholderiales bacterium PBB5]|nr:MAG: hypothetical protein CFE45_00660 [Burkholderiales bacterium PBB5]
MSRMHVNVEALNLRSAPGPVSPETFVLRLHLGQAVDVTGAEQAGWLPVSVPLPAGSQAGFVKALLAAGPSTGGSELPSLRAPMSPAREALAAAAMVEWVRFKFGQGKETVDPFFRLVGEMWKAINLPHDGHDTDIPWSAAAISFMVRNAAAQAPKYNAFRFAASHSRYINDAIKRSGKAAAPFWGFRLHEQMPQIGDLVARSREQSITFEQASVSDAFKSHTDVVVSVRPDEVLAIGGNVSDSVSITRYAKTPAGFLDDSKGVFALLANRA